MVLFVDIYNVEDIINVPTFVDIYMFIKNLVTELNLLVVHICCAVHARTESPNIMTSGVSNVASLSTCFIIQNDTYMR